MKDVKKRVTYLGLSLVLVCPYSLLVVFQFPWPRIILNGISLIS